MLPGTDVHWKIDVFRDVWEDSFGLMAERKGFEPSIRVIPV